MTAPLNFVEKVAPKSIDAMAIAEVVDRIESLNQGIAKFWSKSDGWAPVAVAGLLGKSRLDWQASLSGSLRLWMREPSNALTSAELILAWANLGSLGDETGLSPWWTLPGVEVERHLFALPQSRDVHRFARLCRERSLYRLALGQPRQEELVELLGAKDPKVIEELAGLSLDLSAFGSEKSLQIAAE